MPSDASAGPPGHYEELGVDARSEHADIRAAYLRLARRHHPDRMSDATPAARAEAAARMARINAAWTVLSDPRRRTAYDTARGLDGPIHRSTIRDVDFEFHPLDDEDLHAVDFDDTPTGATGLGRVLTMLPASFFAGGFTCIILGALIGLPAVLALGIILVLFAGLSFLFIPLVALANAVRSDKGG